MEAEKIKTPEANELRCNLRHDALLQDSSNADNENVPLCGCILCSGLFSGSKHVIPNVATNRCHGEL